MNIQKKIKKLVQLAEFSTLKIGGPAEFFVNVKTGAELAAAVNWAKSKQKKITIFGSGSNILINSQGVSGLVIKIEISGLEIKKNIINVGAGTRLSELVLGAYSRSLTGLEWAIGIPGTVGGAVRGNAGAFSSSFSDNIVKVSAYDLNMNTIREYTKRSGHFKYRSSIFKLKNNLIILNVLLGLKHDKRSEIKTAMDRHLKYRISRLPKGLTAGSVFKNISIDDIRDNNPIMLSQAKQEKVIKDKKIPTGWLIDQVDLRGTQIGGAKISDEHANVIINSRQATSDDVVTLISLIKTKVRDKLKIQLTEEIEYIGF